MPRVVYGLCLLIIASVPYVLDGSGFATSVAAAYSLGRFLPENQALAFKWYLKAARAGSVSAAYPLGAMYYVGLGVSANPVAAAYWWRRGAEVGEASDEAALGDAYCIGIGVNPDGLEARRWWRLAERQGNTHAGEMLHGKGCTGKPSPLPGRDI